MSQILEVSGDKIKSTWSSLRFEPEIRRNEARLRQHLMALLISLIVHNVLTIRTPIKILRPLSLLVSVPVESLAVVPS